VGTGRGVGSACRWQTNSRSRSSLDKESRSSERDESTTEGTACPLQLRSRGHVDRRGLIVQIGGRHGWQYVVGAGVEQQVGTEA